MNELHNGQIFLIQTEGSDDGINSTEVVITDLGDIGDDAIVVLEEAVGVGAEETVTLTCDYQQPHQPQQQQQIVTAFTADDSNSGGANTYFETNDLQCFSDIKLEGGSPELITPDLGVHYETVETSNIHSDGTETVIFRVNYDEESVDTYDENGVTSRTISPENSHFINSPDLNKLSLHLVKSKSNNKRSKLLKSDDPLSSMYLCKLCNSYVDKSIMKTHNRNVHQDKDTLTCSDCGKLFTSKRSLFGHKKEKHSGHTEVFICPDCNKQFSRKSNLKAHRESLHFGKKFPCRLCERIFTNRSSMNQHVKKTHSSGSTDMSEMEGSNSGSSSADTSTNSQHLSDLINSNSSIDLSLLEDSVDPLDTVIHRK